MFFYRFFFLLWEFLYFYCIGFWSDFSSHSVFWAEFCVQLFYPPHSFFLVGAFSGFINVVCFYVFH